MAQKNKNITTKNGNKNELGKPMLVYPNLIYIRQNRLLYYLQWKEDYLESFIQIVL